jgi:F-type H+-transporting ATPase subunit b
MPPLFDPQNAEFWILIAIVVFFVVLWRAKAPAMAAKALDDAAAKVRTQLDEARRLREEAQALLAQIHTRRLETERTAAELLRNAQADAERMRTDAAAKLEEDIKRRAQMAERKIALAEAQAANEVKAAAADLASQAAEAVFAARIAGATSDPLIDAGLSRLAARFS